MFYCLESVLKSVRTYCHSFCHHLYLVQGARSSPTAQTTVAGPTIKTAFYILLAEFQWFEQVSLKLKMLSPIWPYEKWIIKNPTTFSSWKVVSPERKINSRWSIRWTNFDTFQDFHFHSWSIWVIAGPDISRSSRMSNFESRFRYCFLNSNTALEVIFQNRTTMTNLAPS